jgi:hypothetical protein
MISRESSFIAPSAEENSASGADRTSLFANDDLKIRARKEPGKRSLWFRVARPVGPSPVRRIIDNQNPTC